MYFQPDRVFAFNYHPEGLHSISCNIIIARDIEVARFKAMRFLEKLQEEKLSGDSARLQADWSNLDDVFISLEPVETGEIIEIGNWIE